MSRSAINSIDPRWYVVEAFEGRAGQACLHLSAAWAGMAPHGFEVWRPFIIRRPAARSNTAIPRRKLPERREARFGRYFFVRCVLTDSVHHEVAHCPGVLGWLRLRGTDRPCAVPDEQIALLRGAIPPKPRGWEEDFTPQARVLVIAGHYQGLEGVIDTVDRRGLVTVTLSPYGRPTRTIFEVGHVERIGKISGRAETTRETHQQPPVKQGADA